MRWGFISLVVSLVTVACGGGSSGGNVGGSSGTPGSGGAGAQGAGGAGGGGAGGGQGGSGAGGGTSLPPRAWEPTGTPGTWNDVSFTVPEGMAYQETAVGFEMTRQDAERTCILAVTPPLAAAGDLAAQAQNIMLDFFGAQGILLADERGGSDMHGHRAHGVSPRGFEYVELTAELRPNGTPSLARGRILLVGLGSTVVPVLAIATDYYGCIQFDYEKNVAGPDTDWETLFYSLKFPGTVPNPLALEQSIIGKWSDFSSGVLNGEIYSPSKRYVGASTWDNEKDFYIYDITGEGSYVVEGDTLARFPDSGGGEANYFRIVARYNPPDTLGPGEISPNDELHQMKADNVGPYELALPRVNE